jgi:hypothetical protein
VPGQEAARPERVYRVVVPATDELRSRPRTVPLPMPHAAIAEWALTEAEELRNLLDDVLAPGWVQMRKGDVKRQFPEDMRTLKSNGTVRDDPPDKPNSKWCLVKRTALNRLTARS